MEREPRQSAVDVLLEFRDAGNRTSRWRVLASVAGRGSGDSRSRGVVRRASRAGVLFCVVVVDGMVDRQEGRGAHDEALKTCAVPGPERPGTASIDCKRETTLSWLKVVWNPAFQSLTLTTPIPRLNSSVPSLRKCGSASIAGAEARERILPGRQAEVAFSRFRRLRIRGFHDAIKAWSKSKWFPGLPLHLWLGAESGVLVQRLRKQKLGEQTGVRFYCRSSPHSMVWRTSVNLSSVGVR